jgi:hypothetical protein
MAPRTSVEPTAAPHEPPAVRARSKASRTAWMRYDPTADQRLLQPRPLNADGRACFHDVHERSCSSATQHEARRRTARWHPGRMDADSSMHRSPPPAAEHLWPRRAGAGSVGRHRPETELRNAPSPRVGREARAVHRASERACVARQASHVGDWPQGGRLRNIRTQQLGSPGSPRRSRASERRSEPESRTRACQICPRSLCDRVEAPRGAALGPPRRGLHGASHVERSHVLPPRYRGSVPHRERSAPRPQRRCLGPQYRPGTP